MTMEAGNIKKKKKSKALATVYTDYNLPVPSIVSFYHTTGLSKRCMQ